MITGDAYTLLIGGVLIVIGLVFLTALFLMYILKLNSQRYIFWLAALLITNGVWICLDCTMIPIIFGKPMVIHTIAFINKNLMVITCIFYLCHYLSDRSLLIGRVSLILQIIVFALLSGMKVTGFSSDGAINNSFILALAIVILIVTGAALFQNKINPNRDIKFVCLSMGVLLIGVVIDVTDILFVGSGIFYGTKFGVGIFALAHGINNIVKMKETYERAERINLEERQLMENSINAMVSQIQPHFMFNCLTAIQQLCAMDPEKAEDAISDFAAFLRVNIDTLRSTKLVPFQKELIHIKHYVSLEKMRFGERVEIKYNIEIEDFLIPSLAVQPLVENAVRYGITKQLTGGTIVISTKKENKNIIITVEDDGLGFDMEAVNTDGKKHLGIVTVRKRVEDQCNGTLLVESQKGKGTLVTMVIPMVAK